MTRLSCNTLYNVVYTCIGRRSGGYSAVIRWRRSAVGRGCSVQRVYDRAAGWTRGGVLRISRRDALTHPPVPPAPICARVLGLPYIRPGVYSPAALASLHSRYMSAFISGLSSAMVSPTVTNRSMAKFTPWPTLAIALAVRSVQNGRSRCATNVDICKTTTTILQTSLLSSVYT